MSVTGDNLSADLEESRYFPILFLRLERRIMDTFEITYYGEFAQKERVIAHTYELANGWFVFYGTGSPKGQVLRIRESDVSRIDRVAE